MTVPRELLDADAARITDALPRLRLKFSKISQPLIIDRGTLNQAQVHVPLGCPRIPTPVHDILLVLIDCRLRSSFRVSAERRQRREKKSRDSRGHKWKRVRKAGVYKSPLCREYSNRETASQYSFHIVNAKIAGLYTTASFIHRGFRSFTARPAFFSPPSSEAGYFLISFTDRRGGRGKGEKERGEEGRGETGYTCLTRPTT